MNQANISLVVCKYYLGCMQILAWLYETKFQGFAAFIWTIWKLELASKVQTSPPLMNPKKGESSPLRKQLLRLLPHGKQAIINVWDFPREIWNLFTLWKSCPTHHRGLIWFRISDRKFVNHTTEMILWSMILVDACKIFEPLDGNAEKALKVRANGKVYVCLHIRLTYQREQFFSP